MSKQAIFQLLLLVVAFTAMKTCEQGSDGYRWDMYTPGQMEAFLKTGFSTKGIPVDFITTDTTSFPFVTYGYTGKRIDLKLLDSILETERNYAGGPKCIGNKGGGSVFAVSMVPWRAMRISSDSDIIPNVMQRLSKIVGSQQEAEHASGGNGG